MAQQSHLLCPSLLNIILHRIQVLPFIVYLLRMSPIQRSLGTSTPFHTNPYFASFASLPGTITHGMFTSAATRWYAETVVAKGVPDRVFK